MPADPATLAARITEAAGDAARRAMIAPGCCMEGTGCEFPPCHCSTVAARAAIAAAVREAGLDREDLLDNAGFLVGGAQARRQHEFSTGGTPGGIAFTDSMERVASLLRALAEIADGK